MTHSQRLRIIIDRFLSDRDEVAFSEIVTHIVGLGFNMGDNEMFADWLKSNFPNGINYNK